MQGSWKCKQATAKERRSVWNGGNLSHMQELWDNCWPKLGYSCCITIRGFFGVVWRGFVFWWPWFLCGCFFFPKHFITYPLTCFTGLWELWHVHFLFPSCNMGCAKGMQSLLQRCIVAVCGRVGWAFIPTFCTAGCEEPPSARSFQSHGIRGAARSSERSYEPRFFFCRQIGKFVIIRLWIWIFF